MMRLEVRLAFGHARFPSADELALGGAMHLSLYRKAKLLISRAAEGTDHGSVYSQFEFLKRDQKKVMQIVGEVLRELSVEHLAEIIEKRPLSSYRIAKPDFRGRSPMRCAVPPTYLNGNATPSLRKGPARRLFSGTWCGHGSKKYTVFDIIAGDETSFRLRLPQSDDEALNPPFVLAIAGKKKVSLYDSREHNGSIYSDKHRHLEPRLRGYFHCPKCSEWAFRLAVGFELPSDSEGPNDTSWFALAAECAKCKWSDLIYDDETQ